MSWVRVQHGCSISGMLSRCAGVLGNAGSRSGKYDCAHLVLTAVRVLAHPFTRASEVPAEYNLVALLIHCLLSDLFFLSCSPHRTIAEREILVAGPIVPTTPLSGFGAFFHLTQILTDYEQGRFSFDFSLGHVLQKYSSETLLSALAQLIKKKKKKKACPLCSRPQKHFLHPLTLNKQSPW